MPTSLSGGSGASPVCVIAMSFGPASPVSSVPVMSSPGVRPSSSAFVATGVRHRHRRHVVRDVVVLDGERGRTRR